MRSFELTGRCTLGTFVRILEALNALADLQLVLVTQTRSIGGMRLHAQSRQPKRSIKKQPAGLKGDAA